MYTSGDDEHEDLFQEILLQLWKGFPAFKGQSKPTTWMYRVALYTAMSNSKKQTRRRHDPLSDYTAAGAVHEDPYQYENLRLAISHLAPADRALVMLYMEEKPYKEIAEILGLTETNVGVRINRIKKKLKEILVVI